MTNGHEFDGSPLVLASLLGGAFVTTYDIFSVNVAAPSIARELGATPTQLQWIVAIYGLAFGATVLAGSRLSEVWGAGRAYRRGVVAFAIATAAAACAPNPVWLILIRFVQGMAAAVLMPQVLTVLARIDDPTQRQKGFAGYGAALGLGPALGQIVAGWAVETDPWQLSWRFPLLMNAALALIVGIVFRTRDEAPKASRLDWPGMGLLCLSMVALIYPLIEGRRLSWSGWLSVPLALGSLGLFLVWRRLHRRQPLADHEPGQLPLIDLRALARPGFAKALLTTLLFYTTNASFFLILSLTLHAHYGLRPLLAAGVFTLMAAVFLIPTLTSRLIAERCGFRAVSIGALLLAAGHGWLAGVLFDHGSLASLITALMLTSFALGLVMTPLVAATVALGGGGSGVSGLTGCAQWLGNAVGAALVGTIYFQIAGDQLSKSAMGEAWAHGLYAVVALIVWVMLRRWPSSAARARP